MHRGGVSIKQGPQFLSLSPHAGGGEGGPLFFDNEVLLHELDALGLAAAPDHFAFIAAGVFRRQRQPKAVADVDRSVSDDLGAAGRDVEHGAFAPGFGLTVVEAHPRDAVTQLPPRFALYLASHGHYPSKA